MSENNNNLNKNKNKNDKKLNNRRVLPNISKKNNIIDNNKDENNNFLNLHSSKESNTFKSYFDKLKEKEKIKEREKENKSIVPFTNNKMTIDSLLTDIKKRRERQEMLIKELDTKYNLNLNESSNINNEKPIGDLLDRYDRDYNSIFNNNVTWKNPFLERERILNPDKPFRSLTSPLSTASLPSIKFKPINEKEEEIIEYEYVDINESIENLKDLIDMIEKYPLVSNVKYNINMKSMHDIKEPLIKLDSMIGMNNLKTNIVDQILYFVQDLHKVKSEKSEDFMHTVIYGPPGTGKTETAKIMGNIFSNLGVLKKKTFKKVTRSDFVAGYLGQTSLKTRDLIKDNLGGVIFIDEAYALGNPEKKDSFSKEALDTLCEALSDYKDQIMVIIAGYEEELKTCFFAYNKGLESRFTWRFETEDYSAKELMLILKKKIEDAGWSVKKDALSESWFLEKMDNFAYFGRDIETLFSKIKISHGRRVFCLDKKERTIITKKDLDNGYKKYLDNRNKTKKEDNQALNTMYM